MLINSLGNVVLTGAPNISTTGASSPALSLTGTNVNAVAGNLSTAGILSAGALVNTVGNATLTTGNVSTVGTGSNGILLTGPVNVAAVICANVATTGGLANAITINAVGTVNLGCANVTTAGSGANAVTITGGGNPITATLGNVSTTGLNADAVTITNAGGNVNLAAGQISTSTDNSTGILINGPVNAAVVTCISVNTLGNLANGIDITATGSVNLTCGPVATAGTGSTAVLVNTPGAVAINVGNVTTGGVGAGGIVVVGPAASAAVVCGNVVTTADNSPGVAVSAVGAININCTSVRTSGANSGGIIANGQTGPVSVTVGPVTTTGPSSTGITTTSTTGAQTILAGNVNVSGAGSNGINATATACADINIHATGNVISTLGTGINASTLCQVTILTDTGTTVSGPVAGINSVSGTGSLITVGGTVTSSAGPAINADGGAATLTTTATGVITGRIDLTDSNDILNNGGTFNVVGTSNFGAGVDVINNLASGIVRSTAGAGVLANCETFNNAGSITMVNGVPTNTLTLCGNYVATGNANLAIDVGGGAAGLTADELIILGNASGLTRVNLALLPGSGIIDTDGVLVVDTGTSAANAFTLGTTNNNSPLLAYAIEQRGADYFLTSAPTIAAFQPLSLAAAATDMWYQSADEVISQTRLPHNPDGFALWGQIYASRDRFNGNDNSQTINGIDYDVDTRTRNHRYGVQGGVDFGFGGGRVGLTGGYAKNKVSSAADLRIKGWNLGVYGQFGGELGFHGEGLFKFDRYRVSVNDGAFAGNHSRLRETGVDGALGYRMGMGSALIDLNAGLSHVRSKIGGIGAFGFAYDYDKITSTRGRAGVRAVFGQGWRPYVDATVLHEFNGKGNVNLFDGVNNYDLEYSGKGTWLRLEAGIGGPSAGAGPILAAWADVGDKKGIGARLGFRFGGAREGMAPPPPPPMAPPPPPPPATQTCADGSVILATDVCPPPPPPPPPAPEPERG